MRIMGNESVVVKIKNFRATGDHQDLRRSLGRSHVSRLAGSGCTWAAGCGENGGGGGNKGEFHGWNLVVFCAADTRRMSMNLESSGEARPCKAKDGIKFLKYGFVRLHPGFVCPHPGSV